MFPTITRLDDLLPHIAGKDEIRVDVRPDGMTIVCYMVSAENTFDSEWAKECRGITFGPDGKIASRHLHKFFNVNEREETRSENLSGTITRMMDKRDGSMISTVKSGNSFRLKSKKSFESDVAIRATEWINRDENARYISLCVEVVNRDATAIFEYTAPCARIVLPYNQASLHLLHIRDNISGRYWTKEEIEAICNRHWVLSVAETNIEEVYQHGFDIDALINEAKTAEAIEGWVLQFENGDMVKLKTDWYLLRHRAMTFLRERDIAQLVIDEGLDDVKSLMVGDGVDIADILQIEKRVVKELNDLARSVLETAMQDKDLDRKTFAIKHREHQFFGLLMAQYTGKEPNFKEYFERNLLRENYTLRQLNLINTVAEVE